MISYVENKITNEIITVDKLKPYKKIRGTGIVQLINSKTGDIEVEAKSENIITNAKAIITYFNEFVSGIGNTNINRNNIIDKIDSDPFDKIYVVELSNTGIEPVNEDIDVVHVPLTHSVICYAERMTPFSGADTSRGTINEKESKFYKEGNDFVAHFVFDFPTHVGNGSFDCIYWADDNYSKPKNLDKIRYNTNKTYENISALITMEDCRNYNVLVAVCTDINGSNGKYKYKLTTIYIFDKDMNFIYKRDMEKYITSLGMSSTIVFNMRSDGQIALIDTDKCKIHLYNYETDSIVKTLNVPSIKLSECMIYEGNYLYTSDYNRNDNDLYTKYKVTEDGSIEKIWDTIDRAISSWSLKVQNGKVMGKYDKYTNYVWIDVSENVKYSSVHLSIFATDYKSCQITRNGKMAISITYEIASDNSLILIVVRKIIGFMGAITKLPSKLTKMETNTMKIQYDIRFENLINKF